MFNKFLKNSDDLEAIVLNNELTDCKWKTQI